MLDDLPGVVLGAVDEARLPAAQEVQPDPVQPGGLRDHAAVVADLALAIDHRDVQPRVVGAEPGGPEHRLEALGDEVDQDPRVLVDPRRLGTRSLVVAGRLVDRVEQALELEVGEVADVAQRAGERGGAAVHRREASDERGAPRGEGVEVEVGPVGRSDELGRGDVPRAHEVVDLVVALVEPAELAEPPHDVAVPVGPRHADVLTHGDRHLAPGAQQLVGELEAGGRGADDEHAAGPQLVGTLVVERGDLVERVRQRRRHRRHPRVVEGAAGDDDRVRLPAPGVGLDQIAVAGQARHRRDGGVRAHGRVDVVGVALEELDERRRRS